MPLTAIKKAGCGKAEIWHTGKMRYEIRIGGVTVATAENLSSAWKSAERANTLILPWMPR